MNQLVLKIIVNVNVNLLNMEWIVRIEKTPEIEDEKDQRIRIVFNPMVETIHFYGEVKLKNRQKISEWVVFSEDTYPMKITLDMLQLKMGLVVADMRKRLKEYENIEKGFTVLKWIAIEEE